MVPDGGSGSWEPQRSIPQRSMTSKEREVISAYRAFMKAVQTAQAAPTSFLGIGFDLDISISEEFSSDERIILEQIRFGNRILTITTNDLEALGAESRKQMSENIPKNAVTVDFETATALCAIEAIRKVHPLKPMTPEEEAASMRALDELERKVDEYLLASRGP